MRKQILIGVVALAVAAAVTYGVAARLHRPEAPAGPLPLEEAPVPVTLPDPKDPTAKWPARYRGNPMLIVVEAYALDTIGELPPRLAELVPELVHRSFNKSGDWKQILRKELGWADTIDQTIKDSWERYQRTAGDAGYAVDSLDFAQQFADAVDKAMDRDAGR